MKNVLFSLVMPMAWRCILYSFWCIAVLFSQPLIASGASPGLVNPQISAGWYHTVALKSDSTVWAWGCNDHGQLGDGTTTDYRSDPAQVGGLRGVIAIAVGEQHTVALKSEGTVWTWGYNTYGQLGDGSNAERNTPVQVSGLSDITAIAAGWEHTIALKSDGTVWTWGNNSDGQLGDGTNTIRNTPVQVKIITLSQIVTKTPTTPAYKVKSITISKSVLYLKSMESHIVSIKLKGDNDSPVKNKEIIAKINWAGKKHISVLPASALTDTGGEVMFTINAKKFSGRAKVTFKADNLRKDITVIVGK